MIFIIPVWRMVLGMLNTDVPVTLHSLYCVTEMLDMMR